MRLRSRIRDEFPRGWFKSGRWWLEGIREIGLSCAAAVATALFARQALRLVKDRDDPVALSRARIAGEAWCAGLLVAAVVLGAGVALALESSAADAPGAALTAAAMIAWSLADIATAATALAVLMRSRIGERSSWEEIDFVDLHASRQGRPPETVEEYRALRLRREQDQHG